MSQEDKDNNQDYDIGYRKPPKHTQFQKGQSGNPQGRPPKTKDAEKLLDRLLEQKVRIKEGGKAREHTMREALLKSLISAAVKGEKDARKMIFTFVMNQRSVDGFTPDAEDRKALADFLQRVDDEEAG